MTDQDIYADVVLPEKRYSQTWYRFIIVVKDGDENVLARKDGSRPTQEWAASAARKISKRMVNAEKKRALSNETAHIKNFRVGR